jgi:hypothetical protein
VTIVGGGLRLWRRQVRAGFGGWPRRVWSLLKRAIANFAGRPVRIVKRTLKKIQCRPHPHRRLPDHRTLVTDHMHDEFNLG